MFDSLSKLATSIALNVSETLLLFFGVLLVVGLVGEYAKSDRWKKYERLFMMFVIVGVAGELVADGGIFTLSAHLQSLSDLEVARLNKEAEDANATAKNFESQIADANLRAADAQRETALLSKKADDETVARHKIETKIADRKLTAAQTKPLEDCLREHPGAAVVVAIANDPGAYAYAKEWREVFDEAKWNTGPQNTPIQVFWIGGGMWTGVRLTVHGDWDLQQNRAIFEPNSTEQYLARCMLNTVGIGAAMIPDKNTPSGHIRVEVSSRPNATP
jgi:hypothetical protein